MKRYVLKESVESPEKSKGNRWRVIVAKPGQGSSGYYSEDVLKEYGPIALAPGAQSFINHDDKRDPKDMIGVFPEGGYWDEDEKALVAELEVFPHWKEFVENVGPHCGMSIYMSGELDEDGNVTKLLPDALNGCDLVARPGLVGSGIAEQLYEAARASTDNRKEETMTIEEVAAKVDKLSDLMESLVAARDKEVLETAQAQADGEAVKAALEAYASAIDAIEAAKLLPSQAADLRARALKGEDVTEAIEAAKKIRDEVQAEVKESAPAGRTLSVVSEQATGDALALGKVFG